MQKGAEPDKTIVQRKEASCLTSIKDSRERHPPLFAAFKPATAFD
jgi:hypothetical protein